MILQQYQDPSISRWLRIGFWYEEHKAMLAKLAIALVIAVNIGFWINTFYGIYKIIISSKYEESMLRDLAETNIPAQDLHQAQASEPISIGEVYAVMSSTETSLSSAKRADFMAIAQNLNQDKIAYVAYYFEWEDRRTEELFAAILPGQEAPLYILGALVENMPSNPLIQTSVKWQRVKDASAVEKAIEAKSAISVSDYSISARDEVTDAQIFVQNNGIYSILAPLFIAALQRLNGEIYAIGIYQAQILSPKEPIIIRLRWSRPLPGALEAKIYPIFDFLNNSSYQLPKYERQIY